MCRSIHLPERRVRVTRALLPLAALAVFACDGDPEDEGDAGPLPSALTWSAVLEDLDGAVLSFWGTAADDLFAVGGSLSPEGGTALVLHHDGEAWHRTQIDAPTLWWVFGFTSEDVWAVGEQGTIVHFDGAAWTIVESEAEYTLWGVWGADPADLWAVGGDAVRSSAGVIRHWDGTSWEPASGVDLGGETFFKVWGTAADDVYVVGAHGTIWRFDGSDWSAMDSPASDRLVTVVGRGPEDVWAVGGLGTAILLHLEGRSWKVVDDPAFLGGLMGIWTAPDEPLIVTGFFGYLALGNAAGFREQDSGTDLCLHAAWGDGAGIYLAGGGDLVPPRPVRGTVLAVGAVAGGPVR
ncbi:MAG: hypothetical protein HYY06_18620 [Deltaproteobacteria bacterium]|nr:hypothetical protein [Deltaproteobacteria bacterium]